jgi:hypothetical protein
MNRKEFRQWFSVDDIVDNVHHIQQGRIVGFVINYRTRNG